MTKEQPNFKIMSKDEAFYNQEMRVSLMQIDSIKQEKENGDKMIEMHEHMIEFCKAKLKQLGGGVKEK